MNWCNNTAELRNGSGSALFSQGRNAIIASIDRSYVDHGLGYKVPSTLLKQLTKNFLASGPLFRCLFDRDDLTISEML